MEAKELRIGNWIRHKYHILLVETIDANDEIYACNIKRNVHVYKDIEDFEPIPLTEEWLIKFGFRVMDSWLLYYKGSFEIEPLREGFLFSQYENDLLNIKYVHQLQNLYFTLTGEELSLHNTD